MDATVRWELFLDNSVPTSATMIEEIYRKDEDLYEKDDSDT